MTLLSYQVFKTVVEQGSFQKASEVLGITPSAVSHAVASMENELGTSLFIRSKSLACRQQTEEQCEYEQQTQKPLQRGKPCIRLIAHKPPRYAQMRRILRLHCITYLLRSQAFS